jgi:hypothetical protein
MTWDGVSGARPTEKSRLLNGGTLGTQEVPYNTPTLPVIKIEAAPALPVDDGGLTPGLLFAVLVVSSAYEVEESPLSCFSVVPCPFSKRRRALRAPRNSVSLSVVPRGTTMITCLVPPVSLQVSLGSSLQFGYGTGVMNNSESFIRGSFQAAGKPYTLHMWAATVSMFGWGGLAGAFIGTKVVLGLNSRMMTPRVRCSCDRWVVCVGCWVRC